MSMHDVLLCCAFGCLRIRMSQRTCPLLYRHVHAHMREGGMRAHCTRTLVLIASPLLRAAQASTHMRASKKGAWQANEDRAGRRPLVSAKTHAHCVKLPAWLLRMPHDHLDSSPCVCSSMCPNSKPLRTCPAPTHAHLSRRRQAQAAWQAWWACGGGCAASWGAAARGRGRRSVRASAGAAAPTEAWEDGPTGVCVCSCGGLGGKGAM